ncbi:MAG: phosphate/phosphite/phosphonate ABC transporter substrate-binding protein [Gemmataceae bacterium]
MESKDLYLLRRGLFLAIIAAVMLFAVLIPTTDAQRPGETVRIGMAKSILRDVPDPMVKLLMVPFNSLMQTHTGLRGKIDLVDDPILLAEQMEKKELQLGVFHGFEFAWARQQNPKLKPLMIAVNRDRHLFAHLVTRSDNDAKDLRDFKGQHVAIPIRTRGHCRLWLERHCNNSGLAPEQFFTKIVRHKNVERALDDIVRGRVQCIVVDDRALNCYKRVKPGCYRRLRILERSKAFPAAVIAYRDGKVNDAMIRRFRSGMIQANSNSRSRQLMSMWNLTAFEPVPADYESTLVAILRDYPAPGAKGKLLVNSGTKSMMD